MLVLAYIFINLIKLHSYSCAHRDLKLENFLINYDTFLPEFADFGLSEIY